MPVSTLDLEHGVPSFFGLGINNDIPEKLLEYGSFKLIKFRKVIFKTFQMYLKLDCTFKFFDNSKLDI